MSERSISLGPESPTISKIDDGNVELGAIVPKSLRERVNNLFEAVHEGDPFKLSFAVGRVNSEELNRTDERGLTVLHYATRSGNRETVEILINHGAQVNVRSTDGRESTPLHIAARLETLI